MARKTLDEELEELYTKGFDRFKVERFAESAAMMAAPVFQAHGIEYGDRVPGLYKLAETIETLFVNVVDENIRSETGRFIVEREDSDDPDWPTQFKIYFQLGEIDAKDLEDK